MKYKELNKHYQTLVYNKNYNENIFDDNLDKYTKKRDINSQIEINDNIKNAVNKNSHKIYQDKNTLKIIKEQNIKYLYKKNQ